MKTSLLLLAVLALPAAAQTAPEPAPAEPETYAAIDPKALKLLARVAEKYERAFVYNGIVTLRFGSEKKQTVMRYRVALATNRGTISKAEGNNVERWISDGRETLATSKNKPKQYVLKPLNVDGFWRIQREEFWKRAGLEGALPELLAGKFGTLLLSPDLKRIDVEPTNEDGATQKITLELDEAKKKINGRMELFIAEDFTLRHVTVRETGPEEVMVWDERHSEVVINREETPELQSAISTTPPAGFRRVESFDEPMQATAPVNSEVQKTKQTNKLKTQK